MRFRASLLGFIEVLIWVMVVGQLIQHLDNWLNFVAYAAGFAAGTFLGITMEDKFRVGTIIIRVITRENADGLIEGLKRAGFMLTRLEAQGSEGPVEIIFMVAKRKRLNDVTQIIESFDTDAFYSIEDVKYTSSEPSDDFFSFHRFPQRI